MKYFDDFPVVELSCDTCGNPCVKDVVGNWAHKDDFVRFNGGTVSMSDYDHRPVIKVIEARLAGESSTRTTTSPATSSPATRKIDPFAWPNKE